MLTCIPGTFLLVPFQFFHESLLVVSPHGVCLKSWWTRSLDSLSLTLASQTLCSGSLATGYLLYRPSPFSAVLSSLSLLRHLSSDNIYFCFILAKFLFHIFAPTSHLPAQYALSFTILILWFSFLQNLILFLFGLFVFVWLVLWLSWTPL